MVKFDAVRRSPPFADAGGQGEGRRCTPGSRVLRMHPPQMNVLGSEGPCSPSPLFESAVAQSGTSVNLSWICCQVRRLRSAWWLCSHGHMPCHHQSRQGQATAPGGVCLPQGPELGTGWPSPSRVPAVVAHSVICRLCSRPLLDALGAEPVSLSSSVSLCHGFWGFRRKSGGVTVRQECGLLDGRVDAEGLC